jgi:MFS family permease
VVSNKTRALLQQPYLKRLFLARFISNYGNGLSGPALAFGILHLKNGSAGELGAVLATTNIALILMLPFGGVIADRLGQIKMVGATDVIGSLGLFVQAGFFATGNVPLPLMLLVNGIFGICWSIWWPAFTGVMPALLPEAHLQKGNSINALISNISLILGAMSAGLLITAFGSAIPLFVDAASFFISGIIVLSFRHLTAQKNQKESAPIGFFQEMKFGWKIFFSFKWIVYVVIGFSSIMMAWTMIDAVIGPIIFAKRHHGPLIWSSIILAAQSVGYLFGALIAYRIKVKHTMTFLTIATLTLPIYITTLHFPKYYLVAAAAGFCWGITVELWGSLWTTALQRSVPREHLSKIASFDGMGSLLFRPLGLTLAAPLMVGIGISGTLDFATGIVLLMIFLILASKEVRSMVMPENL